MEVSSFSTSSSASSRMHCCSSPSESLMLKRLTIQLQLPSVEFRSVNRRKPSPLIVKTGSLFQNRNSFKILCSQKKEVPVLKARSMGEIYDALAARLYAAAVESNPTEKFIVGLAGPPGAGKSTVAHEVVSRVNKMSKEASSFESGVDCPDVAVVLPMDGFHLYRRQLDAMENPEEAHARRGAPWTFDPALLLSRLKTIKNQGSGYVPSFDHGVGDPVEDDIFVSLKHRVVIVEGNYLFLDEGDWKELSTLFDIKWFIDVDIDKAMQRVLRRHISTGKPPDVAKRRIDCNDRPNAELIMKSKDNADLVISQSGVKNMLMRLGSKSRALNAPKAFNAQGQKTNPRPEDVKRA